MLGTCAAIGDIDMATVPALTLDLRRAIDNAAETMVGLDCSRVTFMDSAGYHALVDATAYADRSGHILVIRNASISCARLIRLCDPDRQLCVVSAAYLTARR
jgi:anti-anti-sigma factor